MSTITGALIVNAGGGGGANQGAGYDGGYPTGLTGTSGTVSYYFPLFQMLNFDYSFQTFVCFALALILI
jgi:hypothetical protein